jgi:hypothetical protein
VREGEQEHILLLTIHHIASDGWSTRVLIREMTSLYGAYLKGEKSPLDELQIQYADYAVWQREWLEGEGPKMQAAYWREQLRGAPTVLELATDRARPAMQQYRGATEKFELTTSLSESLKRMSRREGVTLFMTMLAAFNLLLYLRTSRDDIVIGTGVANRMQPQIESLIGCFFNLVPVRTILSGNPSFRTLLAKTRAALLGAFAHQEFPFEKLVEALAVERDIRYTPIFQVLFAFRDAPARHIELHNLSISFYEPKGTTAKFDLTLFMGQGDGRLSGSFEYRTDLFERHTIRRMIEQFQTLLQDIVSDPSRLVMSFSLTTAEEGRKIISDFNEDTDF